MILKNISKTTGLRYAHKRDSLPSPLSSLPSQEKKKNVKGGSKPIKAIAGSGNAEKTGIKSYTTSEA